jgi:hypothetical protein
VRTDLEEHARRDADAQVRQQIIDEITQANPFDVPPSWVNRMIGAYMEAYKIPEEQRQAFAARVRGSRRAQVRRDMLIDAIAASRSSRRRRRTSTTASARWPSSADRIRASVRVAAEGGRSARDRAQHHGRETSSSG